MRFSFPESMRLLYWDEKIQMTPECIPSISEYKAILRAIEIGNMGWEKLMQQFDKKHLAFVKTISMIESSPGLLSDWVIIRDRVLEKHGIPLSDAFFEEHFHLDRKVFIRRFCKESEHHAK